jgi:hypothetical protein
MESVVGMTERSTCFDCLNAKIWPGTSGSYLEPPDEPEANCMEARVDEELEEKVYGSESAAELCPFFRPRMIEKCAYCGNEMNVPRYSWKIYELDEYDCLPVCSKECAVNMKLKCLGKRLYEKIQNKKWRNNAITFWTCPECGETVKEFGDSIYWWIDDRDHLNYVCQGCWHEQEPDIVETLDPNYGVKYDQKGGRICIQDL